MPVASHILTVPLTVTSEGAAQYPNVITQVQFTLNTDSEADAIAAVLLAFGGTELINPNTVNTGTVTYS